GAATAMLAAYAALVLTKAGLPERFSGDRYALVRDMSKVWSRRSECDGVICPVGPTGPQSFVVWGDSHAASLAPAVERVAAERRVSGLIAFRHSCAPLLGLQRRE